VNVLNLPNWTVIEVNTYSDQVQIVAEYDVAPTVCPRCGVIHTAYGHGTARQAFRDHRFQELPTSVLVVRRRYRCRECLATFMQPLPDMDDKRMMTRRLISTVEKDCLRRPFTNVAEQFGLDEKTVRILFSEFVTRREAEDKGIIQTPRWLGIDEKYLYRKGRCVLSNIEERTILDMLPDVSKAGLIDWLRALPDPQAVELVTMDMTRSYRDAVHEVLPDAAVVVDKFHVLTLATKAMDGVRKRLKDQMTADQRRQLKRDRFLLLKRPDKLSYRDELILASWTSHLPLLKQAYDIKEAFYAIYDSIDRQEAEERLDAWLASIPKELREDFRGFRTTVTNWRPYILAYFNNYGVTNAYCESLNRLIDQINAHGRGYSFAIIRARMLYREEARLMKPIKLRPRKRRTMPKAEARIHAQKAVAQASGDSGQPIYRFAGARISTLEELFKDYTIHG
jgi:transposase